MARQYFKKRRQRPSKGGGFQMETSRKTTTGTPQKEMDGRNAEAIRSERNGYKKLA